MSEKSVLRIHSQMVPETPVASGKQKRSHLNRAKKKSDRPRTARHTIVKRKPSQSERLMRNSAVACAVLLGVLTLSNLDAPWAQKAADGIEQALTMRIDLDDTIGELTFVKELMPESALVFLNISGKEQLHLPVTGTVSHPWNEMQPWLMFSCKNASAVSAAEAGTVTAVSPLSDGRTGLLIDHGSGLESLYAFAGQALVTPGETVQRAQQLGTASDYVYFEWRKNGVSENPADALGI